MKHFLLFARAIITLTVMFASGCAPLGSKLGKEQVVARRMMVGHMMEQIIGVPTEHHLMMLVAPDGPELNTVTSETWRFYLENADGRRETLHFLQKRGGNVMPWELIAPIPQTNLWIAVDYTGTLKRVELGHFDFRVICFTSRQITSDVKLDYPQYGEFLFDSEKHVLTYKMKDTVRSYDPLGADSLP